MKASTPCAPTATLNIAICTCRRPRLLGKALESLAAMAMPQGCVVLVTVIDNDPDGSAKQVFEQLCPDFPCSLHYLSEMRRGIPIARNRAIEAGHSLGADYLIFIDDDEWVEEQWLVRLYDYALSVGGKAVISGNVIPELPSDAPSYMKKIFSEESRKTGTELTSCATNNVLVPIYITRELGLRFDESRPFAGGTDTIFFCAAVKLGVRILRCAEAKVHEEIAPVRLSSRWLARRKFRVGISQSEMKREAGRSALGLSMSAGFQCLISALTLLAAVLHLLPMERYYKSLMKLSRNAGVIAGLWGIEVDSYRQID